jgi:hypothetical protein
MKQALKAASLTLCDLGEPRQELIEFLPVGAGSVSVTVIFEK